MRRTEVLDGVRMLKFRDVFGRCEQGRLSKLEAAELLGINERTFRRWCRRYEEEGEAGLLDRRLGKPSARRVPAGEVEEVERLYRERYEGFTAKHFHEHLVQSHSFRWGYSWTKTYSSEPRLPSEGASAWSTPAQAAAQAVARNDAAPGRLPTWLDPGFRSRFGFDHHPR